MSPRERVFAAFAKQHTDRVPVHHIGTCSEVASALLGREAYVGGGIQQWREVTALWEGGDAHAEFDRRRQSVRQRCHPAQLLALQHHAHRED